MNNNRGLMQYFNNQISVYISGDVLYEIMVKVIEKSTGDDGISMQPVKQLCDSCSFPIANIINMSLHQGIVPDVITLARVIPIYKANSIDYLTNYRPIFDPMHYYYVFSKLDITMHDGVKFYK